MPALNPSAPMMVFKLCSSYVCWSVKPTLFLHSISSATASLPLLAETEKERILRNKSALDIKLSDPVNEAIDSAQRRVPDFARGFGSVTTD